MLRKSFVVFLLLLFTAVLMTPARKVYSTGSSNGRCAAILLHAAERALAEQRAKVWQAPDPDYDPVLGYNPTRPAPGAPELMTRAREAHYLRREHRPDPRRWHDAEFHCSIAGVVDEDGELIRYKVKPHFKGQSREKKNGEIYGEFLSSRFSKALGFFADDEWVADVTCQDCDKSLTSSFQGASFTPFQPAAGIEFPLGKGMT